MKTDELRSPTINEKRLLANLYALREFTDTPGEGVTRFSYGAQDAKARAYILKRAADAGCTITIDALQNIRIGLKTNTSGRKTVMAGSHIDTVRNGGWLDGIYGVCGALEVMETLSEYFTENPQAADLLDANYEVVIFAEEEGSNFGSTMTGSKFVTGFYAEPDLDRLTDDTGKTLRQTLENLPHGFADADTEERETKSAPAVTSGTGAGSQNVKSIGGGMENPAIVQASGAATAPGCGDTDTSNAATRMNAPKPASANIPAPYSPYCPKTVADGSIVWDFDQIKTMLELHIEQGPVLDREGLAIGIVDTIFGMRVIEVTLTGVGNHAGATPMGERLDALCTAAECILAAETLVKSDAQQRTVVTVGKLELSPNCSNVIPETVKFSLEVRDRDSDKINGFMDQIISQIQQIAQNRSVECCIKEHSSSNPLQLTKRLIDSMAHRAHAQGIPHKVMDSGAVHDACMVANFADTGMIFVPSINGRSHVPEENTDEKDLLTGVQFLLDTILSEVFKNV